MTKYILITFLVLISLLNLIKSGQTLKCYTCTDESRCTDPFDGYTAIESCSENLVCLKQKYNSRRADSYLPVIRGCVTKDYCSVIRNAAETCFICKHDLCNSSTVVSPTGMFIAAVLLFLFVRN